MFNPFLWYGLIWTAVVILYSFKWSELCTPLNKGLLIFLIVSIIISFVLAAVFRKSFKYLTPKNNTHKNAKGTLILSFFYLLNMVYAQNIPLINILINKNTASYLNFEGIPILGVFIMNATLLYGIYLINIFVVFPSKKVFIEILVIAFLFLLQYNRQFLMVLFMAFVFFYFSVHKLTFKKIIWFSVIILFGLYVFGGLGNIRHGYSWNDTSLCESLAVINDNYPDFLPKQFIWSYIYLVSPLANLNYNVENFLIMYESDLQLFLCFVPEYISKRLPVTSTGIVHLVREYYTVSTAYAAPYIYGDFKGIYIMYSAFVLLICFVVGLQKKSQNDNLSNITFLVLNYFGIMTFFTNSFKFTATSILIVYVIALMVFKKTQDKKGLSNGERQ